MNTGFFYLDVPVEVHSEEAEVPFGSIPISLAGAILVAARKRVPFYVQKLELVKQVSLTGYREDYAGSVMQPDVTLVQSRMTIALPPRFLDNAIVKYYVHIDIETGAISHSRKSEGY